MEKKEHLLYRTSPSGCFWILRLFSFRIKEGGRAYGEEEIDILQRDIEKNSNNLAQKQKQVAVSSIVSVVKNSTSSYCSKYWTEAEAVVVDNGPTMKLLS